MKIVRIKAGDDWTTDNALTRLYDSTKVDAVLNEIAGKDHSGVRSVGTPAIFGMNFQSVSTAQKLPTSDGLRGGYNPDGTPGPLLSQAQRFAIVTSPVARRALARLLAPHLRDVPVLSFLEIPDGKPVEVVAVIGGGGAPQLPHQELAA